MDIQPLDIVIHIINIVVLYILLRALLYKPVRKFMQKRSNEIQMQLDSAAAAEKDATALKASYENQMDKVHQEAHQLLLDGTLEANKSAAAIIETAQQQSAELVDAAREKVRQERAESMIAAEQDIADAAVALAAQILQREIIKEDNQSVIDSFFKVG